MRILTITLTLLLLSVTLCYSQDSKVTKELPKTIGLTEIQKLKDENFQLKIQRANTELQQLLHDRSDLLRAVMKGAGVSEDDFDRYQYNQYNYVFTLQPDKQ